MDGMTNSCWICKFWRWFEDGMPKELKDMDASKGYCHRYPKVEETSKGYWCGEFELDNEGR